MQLVPTTDGAAPTPQPIRAMERWRVAWHGRRDAQHPPPEPGQPPPYVDALLAQAQLGQRAVSEWLHRTIDPIDREAVRILILLDQHRRDPAIAPAEAAPAKRTADDADPQPLSSIPPRITKAREAAAAQKTYRRRIREQEEAEQRLGQLGSTRHHLIELARAAANAHVARYQQLVGLYHTALIRRDPDRRHTGPPAISTEPWLHGDMPLLSLEIDKKLAEKYRWCLKDFASRTSTVTMPVRDVISNPN